MNKTTNKAETCYDDDGLAAALITESMVGLLSNGFLMTLLISPKTKINNLIKVLGMTEVCPLGVSWVSPHPTEFFWPTEHCGLTDGRSDGAAGQHTGVETFEL